MPQEISIRPLTSQDAAEFKKLRIMALTRDPQAFLNTLERETNWPVERYSSDIWYSQSGSPFGYYGAWMGTSLAGYVKVTASGLVKQKHVAFLYNLYVSPDFRNQKVASTLFSHVVNSLKKHEVECIYASCIASNELALLFYQKMGFEKVGIQPKCVKWNGMYDDEVSLYLELGQPKL